MINNVSTQQQISPKFIFLVLLNILLVASLTFGVIASGIDEFGGDPKIDPGVEPIAKEVLRAALIIEDANTGVKLTEPQKEDLSTIKAVSYTYGDMEIKSQIYKEFKGDYIEYAGKVYTLSNGKYGFIDTETDVDTNYKYIFTSNYPFQQSGDTYYIENRSINKVKVNVAGMCDDQYDVSYDYETILVDNSTNILVDNYTTIIAFDEVSKKNISMDVNYPYDKIVNQPYEKTIITETKTLRFQPKCEFKSIDANTLELSFIGEFNKEKREVNIDPFSDATCDEGDTATTCYLNHSYTVDAGEYINVNNLIIKNLGNITYSVYPRNYTINATGNVTIEDGGKVLGVGISSTSPSAGLNITIIAEILNISSTGLIDASGGGWTSDSDSAIGRIGGIVNITVDQLISNGNITSNGGHATLGGDRGSGGDGGTIIINTDSNIYLGGYISLIGGNARSICSSGGTRGQGGLFVIDEENYNLTLNGSINTNPGANGACNNGIWKSSYIKTNYLSIGSSGIVKLAGNISVLNTLLIDGQLGPEGAVGTTTGVHGGYLIVNSSIFNLTAIGRLNYNGGNSSASGTNAYAGNAGTMNVTGIEMYLDGNIYYN